MTVRNLITPKTYFLTQIRMQAWRTLWPSPGVDGQVSHSCTKCCSESFFSLMTRVLWSKSSRRQTKLRSHILYNDFDLNTDETVYLNIYQNFVLTAMKMHQYIRNWGIRPSKSPKYIKGISDISLHVPKHSVDLRQTVCARWFAMPMQL